jgi:proline dehydrogenase
VLEDAHFKLFKKLTTRFVAGETLDTALAAVVRLNARNIAASLDLLGESVHNEAEARAAGEEYMMMLDRIHERKANANVSVKLTAMGLDISEELCVAIMQKILQRARDTEVRPHRHGVERVHSALDLPAATLPGISEIGIVLQSYLYRTFADVQHADLQGACGSAGAYKEPEAVAFPDDGADANYVKCMQELMPVQLSGIATREKDHQEAKRFAKANDIPTDRYEFQMPYGVRRDLQ